MASFSFILRNFFGFSRKSSMPQRAQHDIEAQVVTPISVTGYHTTIPESELPIPGSARTRISRIPSSALPQSDPSENAVDIFFGVARSPSCGTADSRHDERPAPSSPSDKKEAPPAYLYPVATTINEMGEEELPTYAQSFGVEAARSEDDAEPITLAQYFFKYGFFCPLLWFLSIFIFMSPLSAPTDWESTKTPAQREHLLRRMRDAEVRWAKRSLFAACTLLALIAIIVIAVVFSRHH
ncbi:hypothetical protein OF83DRAFT_1136946 [Amylostereum chailletii]|nr:hypothetical protein OF83DRAFT_1136946 [Amylostereum chailletii]